jgi:hypothetical protein
MNIITIITLTCDSLILVVTRFIPALYNSHFDRRHFVYATSTLRLRYDYGKRRIGEHTAFAINFRKINSDFES